MAHGALPSENQTTGELENPKWADEKRREIRLRRSHLLDLPEEASISLKIATTREELEACFKLVWEAYVKVGLQAPDKSRLRLTKYHLMPSTKVLVALHRSDEADDSAEPGPPSRRPSEVVGTLTLVGDSAFGLPMEEVCKPSVDRIRAAGGNPAEVIGLAVNPKFRSHNVMMYLYKLMFEYARMTRVTDITCSVTKRHIRFYRTMLLFRPMGRLKPYGPANGIEVQCHRLNIAKARELAEEVYHSRHFDADLYTFFFTDNPSVNRPKGEGEPWTPEIVRYFVEQQTDLKSTLTDKDIALLRAVYAAHEAPFPY